MVIERVVALAADLCPVPAAEIRPAMSLYGDLGLSSLEIVMFVACLEKEFGIVLREQRIDAVTTIADVARLVESVHRSTAS